MDSDSTIQLQTYLNVDSVSAPDQITVQAVCSQVLANVAFMEQLSTSLNGLFNTSKL